MYNESTVDLTRQVQAIICLNAFDRLVDKTDGRCTIVPLKGIDLMRSVYAETLDRELKDIDLLVTPAERAMDFVDILKEEGYKPEFSFALDEAALRRKRKVSMIAPSDMVPNVDVHLALITKKYFSETIGSFNDDAVSRIRSVDGRIAVLDDVDRWLFLASHLAFHYLEGEKWYRDLDLLFGRMDEEKRAMIAQRAMKYNMERVVAAVCLRMRLDFAVDMNVGKRFLNYIRFMERHPEQLGHGIRLGRYYWEFVFISKRADRRRAFRRMVFSSIGGLQNIYRCNAFVAALMYVPHLLMNGIGLLAFAVYYLVLSFR